MSVEMMNQAAGQAAETSNEAPTTPAEPAEGGESGGESKEAGEEDKGAEPPAFTPNYKVKVMDNEVEIDDFLRSGITDAEKEKKVRELYEKAYGLDHYKTKYSNLETTHKEILPKFQQYEGVLATLAEARNQGDVERILELAGVDEDKFWTFVKSKVEFLQKSPEEQAEINRVRELQMRERHSQVELHTMREQYQQQLRDMKNFELQNELSKPEVAEAVKGIDARLGQPGSFVQWVRNIGMMEFQRTKKDISAKEAVERVLKLAGWEHQGQAASQQATVVAPVVQKGLKTLPKINNASGGAVGGKVRSLADLQKLADNFNK